MAKGEGRRRLVVFLSLILCLAGTAQVSAIGAASGASGDNGTLAENWIDYVNPFIGVGDGHCYPAVTVPFGFTQWTPQSKRETGGVNVPYWGEGSITGFRGSHYPSGACMNDYASIAIQPQAGTLKTTTDARDIPMTDATASPAYFACTLKDFLDVRVELTATTHCGFFRFTFTGVEAHQMSADAYVLVDSHRSGSTEIHGEDEIWGLNVQRGRGSKIVGYSVVKFDKPFLPSSGADGNLAHADYRVDSGDTILAKVGTSYISFDQARANLDAEIPDWDFDRVRDETREIWNRELGRIEVEGGTEDQRVIFYTALYRSMQVPRVFSEYGRYYSAFDDTVHSCEGYEAYNDFSLWDTYRSEHSLLTIIQPEREADMCQALVDMYEEGGWMPKWPNPGYSGIMIGTHGDSVVAETYLKGVTNFDVEKAYEACRKNAMDTPPMFYEARGGIQRYKELGYVSAEIPEATSRTLEFAYDDYCIAQLAKALGKEDDYELFMERASYYKNVYDPEAPGEPFPGFVRGRNADGSWTNPGTYSPTTWYGYITEGCPYQYTWYVPHDVQGLINLMGGRDRFNEKLDYLFEQSKWAVGSDMGPYYWHGNEPSQHIVYLYDYSGKPWRTQELVRAVMETRYWTIGSALSGGMCGNDDCGQTSSWYVLSAMGFYPVCPAQTTYQIGSPIFDKVTVHLDPQYYPGGDFVIIAHNNSAENMYIQSATLNGEPLEKPWFTHSDLDGGTLVFQMGPEPNYDWGSDPEDAPPSMTKEAANFVREDLLEVSKATVKINEPFEVSTVVRNEGGIGTVEMRLYVDGELFELKRVIVDPGERMEISFTPRLPEPGDHEVTIDNLTLVTVAVTPRPAEFEYSGLEVTMDVSGHATVNVTAWNVGSSGGIEDIDLYLDGEVVDSKPLTLGPGEEEEVSFTIPIYKKGTHEVSVGGLTESFKAYQCVEGGGEEEEFPLIPVIGGVVAVIVVIAGVLLWRRR